MKKFLAIMLAVLCICTMGIAATDIQGGGTNDDPTYDSTDVLYEVSEGYIWNIHAAIDFGDDAGVASTAAQLTVEDQTVAVTRNIIGDGKKLQITIDAYSCSDDQGTKKTDHVFQVANGNSQLAYTVTGDTAGALVCNGGAAGNGVVLEVNAGTNQGSEDLTFVLATNRLVGGSSDLLSEVAGSYYGKVAYTAAIVNQ